MKVCLKCQKEFEPKRERAKFCSDICRAGYHQALKTAKPKLKFQGPSGRKAADLFKQLMVEVKSIKYSKTDEQSFDGKKLDKYTADEPAKWHEPTEKEEAAIRIAEYQKELSELGVGSFATQRRKFIEGKIKLLQRKL